MKKNIDIFKEKLPVIPIRDIVIFPKMVVPLFIGREKSISAINYVRKNKIDKIVVVAQKTDSIKNDINNIFNVGTYVKIIQIINLPDNTYKVLIEGKKRVHIENIYYKEDFIMSDVKYINSKNNLKDKENIAFKKLILSSYKEFIDNIGTLSSKKYFSLHNDENNIEVIIDTIISNIKTKVYNKQQILKEVLIKNRAQYLLKTINEEIDLLNIERDIKIKVKDQIDKNQKEYYLNEQLKIINKEIGNNDSSEIEKINKKIIISNMSKDAKRKCFIELKKIKNFSLSSAESSVSKTYIETLLSLPWDKKNKIKHDIDIAKDILDKYHYGLEKVKERILEYLSVQKRVKKITGQILCLVGPPGVGKTSICNSISKATGRKFIKMSLGGIKDESEIRGHRKTYIGALPGQIMQKIQKSNTNNPLFLLDEIDKISSDFMRDPSSAMLEVLDSDQNNSFYDNYLETDYNLSEVMFIATANTLNILPALLDRMEVIYINGYTDKEKVNIAKKYLINKIFKNHGIKKNEIKISDGCIEHIVTYYTRESGVRVLSQFISKICRKALKNIIKNNIKKTISVNKKNIEKYIGIKKYFFNKKDKENTIGKVNGLAWTEVGGELLPIESIIMPGKGKIKITGCIGNIMHESIDIAFSLIRSRINQFGISKNFYEIYDFHIHVPEGATPKDGPSAGIAMCIAILSSVTKKCINKNLAVTGEVTLLGDLIPIGGLKEKLLAAIRSKINNVIIPIGNKKDLKEMPSQINKSLNIICLENIDSVFNYAFCEN